MKARSVAAKPSTGLGPTSFCSGVAGFKSAQFPEDAAAAFKNYATSGATSTTAIDADRVTYQTWREWQRRTRGFSMPEGELRQIHETTPEGHLGR